MLWWQAAILGLIQGLTEFLPISSSGHLVLGKFLLGVESSDSGAVTFEIFVHFGTVLSILTVYRNEVRHIVVDSLRSIAQPSRLKQSFEEVEGFRTAILILVTLIPTGLAYILFKDFLEARFGEPRFVCAMLFVTGFLLLLTTLRKNPSGEIGPMKALLIGVSQAFALMPGISRSGATICAALYANTSPKRAADFSFLMLLPVVIGATIIKIAQLSKGELILEWVPILIGTIVAYVSGIAAIRILIEVVRRGKLEYFAIYCFLVGGFGLWYLAQVLS